MIRALLLLVLVSGCGRALPTDPAAEECALILRFYGKGVLIKTERIVFPCEALR